MPRSSCSVGNVPWPHLSETGRSCKSAGPDVKKRPEPAALLLRPALNGPTCQSLPSALDRSSGPTDSTDASPIRPGASLDTPGPAHCLRATAVFYAAGGLPMQEDVEEGTMNVQAPVVFDEAKLPELVHEPADPRACGTDHLRQHFLTDLRNHRFGCPFLTKAS